MNSNPNQICLEIEPLVLPISESSPSGDQHIYTRQLRAEFVSLRKPETPSGDDDTGYRRTADWKAVVDLAQSALQTQTKDLRIICHLIEAETQLHGFAGLNSGLELLTTFVTECWDRCNPPIEDGDVEVRTMPIENMLDDPQRGVCFPLTIRQLMLLGEDSDPCSLLDFQALNNSSDPESEQNLTAILAATDAAQFSTTAGEINTALERLDELKIVLDAKLGDQAPGLTQLRESIRDCQRLASELSSQFVAPEPISVGSTESENPTDQPTSDPNPMQGPRGLNSRADAYRQLSEIAEYLQQIEPHSPIPYLVHRAVDLGRLPFPQLVTKIVREENILNELYREFGITDATGG